jgi:hypothetical protein
MTDEPRALTAYLAPNRACFLGRGLFLAAGRAQEKAPARSGAKLIFAIARSGNVERTSRAAVNLRSGVGGVEDPGYRACGRSRGKLSALTIANMAAGARDFDHHGCCPPSAAERAPSPNSRQEERGGRSRPRTFRRRQSRRRARRGRAPRPARLDPARHGQVLVPPDDIDQIPGPGGARGRYGHMPAALECVVVLVGRVMFVPPCAPTS